MLTSGPVSAVLVVVVLAMLWSSAARLASWGRLADLYPSERIVAAGVIFVAEVVVLAQVLGLVGLLGPVGLVAASTALAVAVRRLAPARTPCRARPAPSRRQVAVAAFAAAAVGFQWLTLVGDGFRQGIESFDSTHYHLPFAARFVQTGSITSLHHVADYPFQAFHPANAEVQHAVLMALLRSDLLSLVVNTGYVVLALAAAWAIGRTRDVPHLAVVAVATVLSFEVASGQAGTADNDVATMALLLSSTMFVVAEPNRARRTLAAVAGGLALGTKLTAVGPFVVLLAVAVARRPSAWRAVVWRWSAAAVCGAGVWFGRNLIHTGNPLPTVDLALGPVDLPGPDPGRLAPFAQSLADYASDPGTVAGPFAQAQDALFGPLWLVVWGIAVIGGACAVVTRRHRALGVVVVAALAIHAVTPSTAFGPPGEPMASFIGFNTRYALFALVAGPLALLLVAADRSRWLAVAVPVALVVARIVRAADGGGVGLGGRPGDGLWIGAGAVGAWLVWRHVAGPPDPTDRRGLLGSTVGAVVACAVLALSVAVAGARYEEVRYATSENPRRQVIYDVVAATSGRRIASAGFLPHYALYGPELDNHVQVLGRPESGGGHDVLATCPEWVERVNAGTYDNLVAGAWTLNATDVTPDEAAALGWAEAQPTLRLVAEAFPIHVFAVTGPLVESACPDP